MLGKKVIALLLACMILAVLFAGCECRHEWIEATCADPKICSKCGEKEGSPIGHKWLEATCTQPRTCSVCGRTDGEKAEHTFGDTVVVQEATCSESGKGEVVCTVCGYKGTVTIPITDHVLGDWVLVKEATFDEDGERKQLCTVCGKQVHYEKFPLPEEEREPIYKQRCTSVTYEQLARDPELMDEQMVCVTGQVFQVMESTSPDQDCSYLVSITYDGFLYTDTVKVDYKGYGSSYRILENDIVTFYGVYKGLITYESVLGQNITVPYIKAEYITIR